MVDKRKLSPAHPTVRRAKNRFEKGCWNRKVALSFRQLLKRYAACTPYSVIAKECGVTKQAVHQMRNRHFLALLKDSNDSPAPS